MPRLLPAPAASVVFVLLLQRQGYRNARAFARRAVDIQPAPVPFDDVLDDRQTQSGAARCPAAARIGAVEPAGEMRNMLGRDAFAAIGHGQP